MKQKFTLLFLFVFLFACFATSTAQTTESDETFSEANLVKINLAALPASTFSVQYERAVAEKISVALGLRLMPESGLPLKSFIKNLIDDDEAWGHFENLKISNFALTPEVRFYMGQSVFRGFYIAPFARYANYNAKMSFDFEYEHPITGTVEDTMPLDGKISTLTGGVMFGAQWKLSKLVYLDWWILGPHYGTSSGDITGHKSLSSEEQTGLREALSDLDDLPFVKGYEVSSTGAQVDIKGPWGGVRAGVALGFRF
jgi:hypothetical protein